MFFFLLYFQVKNIPLSISAYALAYDYGKGTFPLRALKLQDRNSENFSI